MGDYWGRLIISLIVLVGFFGYHYVTLYLPIPNDMKDIVLQTQGGLLTLAAAVVTYWVGSSAGSARKDMAIHQRMQEDERPRLPPEPPKKDAA